MHHLRLLASRLQIEVASKLQDVALLADCMQNAQHRRKRMRWFWGPFVPHTCMQVPTLTQMSIATVAGA